MSEADARQTRRLIVLGSTGSIGVNALEVVAHLTRNALANLEVVGLAAGRNVGLIAEQSRRFDVPHVAIADEDAAQSIRGIEHVYAGTDAALEMIETIARPGDLVLGAMVGAAGLPPTLAAIERGCDIALANKETLVAAGELVMPKVRSGEVNLLPVDSEHSALAQCLRCGRSTDEVRRLVLTASGGPFRTWPKDRLQRATVAEALDHPTWDMGRKITIDSASMMNKALEVIEAHWLFGLPAEKIDVLVHPQSIVHSFVEFVDGSVMAQLGPPDMRTPIQYALTWPERVDGCSKTMNWSELSRMEFEPVDHERFPAVRLAYEVVRAEGSAGAIFNAANEAAVEAFLSERIPFGRISALVGEALAALPPAPLGSLDDALAADRDARRLVEQRVQGGRKAAVRSPAATSRPPG
jgi:1-deoxy-D-xylulose-5-phosphate reductoisomerase